MPTEASASPSASPSSPSPGDPGDAPRGRWWALGPGLGLLALVAALIGSLLLQARDYEADVPAADWAAAAAHIRAHAAPGDLVRVVPYWNDDARVFLDGLDVDPTQTLDPDVINRHDRLWVVAGYRRGEQARAAVPDAYPLEETTRFGRVDLLRFDVPEALRPRYDFLARLEEATVRRVSGERVTTCDRWRPEARDWQCGPRPDPHIYVGLRLRDLGDAPRQCIYAAPPPGGAWLEVAYDEVTLSERLVGRVGFTSWAWRAERGGVTDYQVMIDGQPAWTTTLDPQDPTLQRFDIDTRARAGQTATVTFRVHAGDFFDRFLCFTAQVPAPGAP